MLQSAVVRKSIKDMFWDVSPMTRTVPVARPAECGFRLNHLHDGLKSFIGFEQVGFRHFPRTQPVQSDLRKGAKSVVPLADRAIGNLQQWLIGTYHGVSREQLPGLSR